MKNESSAKSKNDTSNVMKTAKEKSNSREDQVKVKRNLR